MTPLPFLLLAAFCQANGETPVAGEAACRAGIEEGAAWRATATDDDHRRIRNWRTAWVQALAQAEAGGAGDAVKREGALLDPDAAIEWRDIPPGDYACRTLKVGNQGRGLLPYVAYPPFTCRIRTAGDDKLRFMKTSGSQRPIGTLYPDGNRRRVFLGTLQLGDEQRAFRYGQDQDRDMAGILERVDERRWRLVLPYPHFESTLDVIELVPKGE
ncbi:MAG TPA: DUF4893 domain-containing protein [Allosphingosinicella sp.]